MKRWSWRKASGRLFLTRPVPGMKNCVGKWSPCSSLTTRGDHFIEEPAVEVAAKMMAQEKPESLVGQQLGSYQILSLLGTGGMGVVYKARDTRLNRSVAIKVLPPDQVSDPERKRRFIQEARAASALNHPNIITIYDIGSEGGIDFIVMEYVAGKTLDQLIPRKGMRLNEALKLAVQMADALAKAHSAGIVHRDLKPGNVMVTEDGLVKVLDFGLAKLTEVGERRRGDAHTRVPDGRRDDCRDSLLHVARAGGREEGRCPVGHLQLWRGALRDGHRAEGV